MSATEENIQAKMETAETCAGEQMVYESCGPDLKTQMYPEHVEDHTYETSQSTSKTEPDLTNHQQLEHRKQKPFVCQICNSAHQFEFQLTKHIKTIHEKSKPYKCDICHWTFGLQCKLAKHKLYVHDKYKPFECHLCQRRTSSKSDLVNHIRKVHEKVKDFPCEKCGKYVSTKSSLRKHHLLMHENLIADIPCTECGKLFRTKINQILHIQRVHLQIKNFQCEFCETKFNTRKECRLHMQRRHINVHIRQNKRDKIGAKSMHKKQTQKSCKRSSSQRSSLNQEKSTFKHEEKVETQQNETVSLNYTLDNLLYSDTELDEVEELLKEYDMARDLGETLKHIRNITYPKQQLKTKPANTIKVKSEILREEELIDQVDGYIENLKMTTRGSVSQSEYEDSGFDTDHSNDTYFPNINTLKLGEAKTQITKQSHSNISTADSVTESWSSLLEIYSSSTSKEPITNQEWVQVEQFLIEQLTTEISTGVISALQVKILDSGFDKIKKMGIIHVMDAESKEWYQHKIANICLDGKCFRAWSENEDLEVYQLELILPRKLNSLSETFVVKMLGSFNPQLNVSQIKVNQFVKIENEGRRVHLEVSKETYQLIEDQEWKLDFVMGQLDVFKARN